MIDPERLVITAAEVGPAVKVMRLERGLSQQRAADLLRTSQPRLSNVENAHSDVLIGTLHRWAEDFGYDMTIVLTKRGHHG